MMNRSRHVRLFLLPTAALAVFALLAGCTAVAAEPVSTPTPVSGLLVGHVYWKGGLNPESTPVPAKLTATAIHASEPAAHDFEAGSDGSFSVGLPPGQYTITGMLVGKGSALLTTPTNVTVQSGDTTQVDLTALHP